MVLFVRGLEGEREPRWTAIGVGVIAGLGCALKPSYAIAFVLMEIAGAMRGHRLFRAASLSFAATALIYGAMVVTFCPAFLSKGVPLALALYGGTDTPMWQIMWESRRLLFGQAVVLTLYWVNRDALQRKSPFLRHLVLGQIRFPFADHPGVQRTLEERMAVRWTPTETQWEAHLIRSLGGRAPTEVFLGQAQRGPADVVLPDREHDPAGIRM